MWVGCSRPPDSVSKAQEHKLVSDRVTRRKQLPGKAGLTELRVSGFLRHSEAVSRRQRSKRFWGTWEHRTVLGWSGTWPT